MNDNQEELITGLVDPVECNYHLNQVAGLTANNILFLKKKFISTSGSEIIKYPISDCIRIIHKEERPLLIKIAGIFLILLMSSIFYMLITNWNSLNFEIISFGGLLMLAALYGIRWTFGSRRHKLIFTLQDGTELIWKSRPGDYKLKLASIQKVIEFAESVGLMHSSMINPGH